MYYIKNNETGKIELHLGYEAYQQLTPEQKQSIKSNFLFSRSAGAWVSRAKEPNLYSAIEVAKKLNLEYKGEEGEKLSFAEQVSQKAERAENKAQYYDNKSARTYTLAAKSFESARSMLSVIPMVQPILVGHHSERGHRALLNRADNAMRKSCELDDKAEYYSDKAAGAAHTAKTLQFKNPVYLGNRIREVEAEIRMLKRRLQGKLYNDSPVKEISPEYREKLETLLNAANEKLDFYNGKLSELGNIYTKERLQELKATHIKYRGTWYPLKSLNNKSVTVLNWLDIAGFTWKPDYTDIQGAKTIDDRHIVYDRDGKEVKPQIKHKDNGVKVYNNINAITEAAESGKVIDLTNLFDLVNPK